MSLFYVIIKSKQFKMHLDVNIKAGMTQTIYKLIKLIKLTN